MVCLIAPGPGFGVLTVVGTKVLLTGTYEPLSWLVSLVPFFLFNNLLLLNQYPDVEADASVGRRHFPIAYRVRASNIVYAVFAVAAYARGAVPGRPRLCRQARAYCADSAGVLAVRPGRVSQTFVKDW
jgi:1,4-dihydroxy-2-naphthoate octaprenyltransferase